MGKLVRAVMAVLNSLDTPVVVTDMAGIVISWNRQATVFFGNTLAAGSHIYGCLDVEPARLADDIPRLTGENFIFYTGVHVKSDGANKIADVSLSSFSADGVNGILLTVKVGAPDLKAIPGLRRFKGTVDESPSSIIITDRLGRVEYANRNFLALSGYSLDELVGQNVSILQPEFFSRDNSIMWERLGRGEKWKGEFLNLKKNGELYWAIVSLSPIFDRNGEVSHYISIQEDITYLKKKEEDLKKSEEKLRILFESLPEGILVTDLEGRILQANRAYLAIFGFTERGDVEGRNIHELFDAATDAVIRDLFAAALLNGKSGVRNHERVKKITEYIDLQAVLMSADDCNPRGFLVLASDVTERKNSERALRESEARNRALIEAIPDIMFRVNDEGVYLDKMLGTKIKEVFPVDVAVKAVHFIAEATRSREIQIFEYPVTVSMEERFYEARFIAIEDHEVLVILRNVTERKKALDEIESSRREAELANRAKSEFLANMSHEIRTPLNSITGFIELLMRTNVDEAQQEYLGIVKKSAANLLEIINDILDFSKIESHKLEINMVEFDPYLEFEVIVRLFSVRAREKNIKFISYIDPQLPSGIVSDPLRIKQILSNLLSNAIKFTPEKGSVVIEVKLLRLKDDICMITFSVADTGIGIPERKQAGIFEAFTQADGSITRKYGGTGLGLSISSNLVKLLGSEIVLESRIGVGSRFYFTLEAGVSRKRAMRDSFTSLAGVTACIVSSSPDDLSLLNVEYYLQGLGVNINFVHSAGDCDGVRCDIFIFIHSEILMGEIGQNPPVLSGAPAILIAGSPEDYSCRGPGDLFRRVICLPLTPGELALCISGALGLAADSGNGFSALRESGKLKFRGKVLVGEDNIINQKLMLLLLRDYGVDVRIAGNGLDVFESYKKGEYDLVLMDIHMPVADGIETAGMIRDYETEKGFNHVPIIALTAKVLKEDMATMFGSGMDGYLSKPVEIERLEAILSEYLEAEEAEPAKQKTGSGEGNSGYYDLKRIAGDLRIPVNVLESIGREFFDDAIEGIWELRTANQERDYRMMKMISHKLKGASANLRFTRLAKMLEHIEENSSDSNKEFDYGEIIKDIIMELDLLKTFF